MSLWLTDVQLMKSVREGQKETMKTGEKNITLESSVGRSGWFGGVQLRYKRNGKVKGQVRREKSSGSEENDRRRLRGGYVGEEKW